MLPYQLIDMVLYRVSDLETSIRLHRHWISKMIIHDNSITLNNIIIAENLFLLRYLYRIGYSCRTQSTIFM